MEKGKIPKQISDVTTPCLLVDIDRLKNNAERMLNTCRSLQVDLRSHTKTHKTVEAAVILSGGTRKKIACSTLPECEMYADNGFDDILLAFPISADKIAGCVQLANRLEDFHVLLSSVDGLDCLKAGTADLEQGKTWSIFIELDCGYGRTGIYYEDDALLEAARDIQKNPSLRLQGLYTHCGQAYDEMTPKERKEDQKNLVNKLLSAAKRLRAEDIKVPVVGTGSTPTCSMADPVLSKLDEFHPGNYVFNDYEQVLLGSCRVEDIACCVATRVVCRRPDLGMLVVDCGFLGLGHDGMLQRPDDFCIIKDHPHLRMIGNTQELGKIKAKEGETIDFDQYPLGTMLFIYPFHSCATAALHAQYLVHCGQKIVDVWKTVKGW